MAATVTPHLSNPDPNANPTTFQGLVDNLNPLFDTVNVIGGPFTPYVISSTTPVVNDQDKIWAKIDANGRPTGLYLFYNGYWRKFFTGKVGQISMFNGNPTTYFDTTGLGWTPQSGNNTEWDGWAICNGQNGTPNLSNQFIVGAQMDNVNISGYAGHWQTNITGSALQTGGNASYIVKNTDLPNMTVQIVGRAYSAGAGTGINHTIVSQDWAGGDRIDSVVQATFGSSPPLIPQTSFSTVPPFYAMAFAMWSGYI